MSRRSKTQKQLERTNALAITQRTKKVIWNQLVNIVLGAKNWHNVPDTIDVANMEYNILTGKSVAIFLDEEADVFLALPVATIYRYDINGNPIEYDVRSEWTGYSRRLTSENSVIIYDNMLKWHGICGMSAINDFVDRLYRIKRIMDVNLNAQKTPIMVTGEDHEMLSLENLYRQYSGDAPVIFGTNDIANSSSVKVLRTDAPFIAPQLYEMYVRVWNEALTFFGVPNVSYQKKERMIADEVDRMQGGVTMGMKSPETVRQEACLKLQALFPDSDISEIWFTARESDEDHNEPQDGYNDDDDDDDGEGNDGGGSHDDDDDDDDDDNGGGK